MRWNAPVAPPVLVPEASGTIERLLMSCPDFAVEDFADTLRAVLSKRPPAHLTVVAHRKAAATVRGWLGDDDVKLIEAPDDVELSMWAQDGFLVGEGPLLVEPVDRSPAADYLGLPRRQTPLRFQGGNVLVGDDFVLLGADCSRRSGEGSAEAFRAHVDSQREVHILGSRTPIPLESERQAMFEAELWRDVRHYKNTEGTEQPLFHLDLYVTLTGGRRVLVGDPGSAAKLCGHDPWPHAMQEAFDDVAAQLDELGFEVIRNPLPLLYMDERELRLRTWYFASYNNVIVSGKTVWLPAFADDDWPELAATDEANAAIWRALGFETVSVRRCRPLAENLGGLHCLLKCLERSPAEDQR